MSFTSEIKKELIMIEADKCCIEAEISALIQMNGLLSSRNNRLALDIQTESPAIARRIFSLLKELKMPAVEISVRKKMKLKKNNIYIVRMRTGVEELLEQLQIDYEGEGFEAYPSTDVFSHEDCKKAYLRGAFLGRGSINNPETSSYHLEIFNVDAEHNHFLYMLLADFDLHARELQRRNGFIVYLKEAEKITEYLSVIGAMNALFKFEDVRIVRDMRNSVNRIVNCETANLNKTISASVRQKESIKFIQNTVGLDELPEKLKEIAEIRLQYPDVNLKEIGQLLPSGNLSKSGVNHRLKKIETFAETLEED
ncbi:MAG TPA: DNA-binding protein WhiA [Pseudogracilibacillus sp.]|nr:DNA-binding protein WhiA [Pseudogracilibacillus sp.]